MSIPLQFGDFTGTAEQLLYRVATGTLDIREVPMSPAVQQLVAALSSLPARRRLTDAGDDLSGMARALEWKSTAFLPDHERKKAEAKILDEAERERREQQRQQDRKLAQTAAGWLAERLVALGGILETEDAVSVLYPDPEEEAAPPFPSLWTLSRKFQWLEQDARIRRREREQLEEQLDTQDDGSSVHDMIEWVAAKLHALDCAGTPQCADAWFEEFPSARRKALLFLALLELARQGTITLRQDELFAPVWTHPKR